MSLTIYTLSDPSTIGNAMTGIAMFFGQDSWVGTAIKTGLLLSLLMILAQTVTNNGLRLDVMIMQLVLVWVLFLPKTTVTVEHFNNAAPPVVVDDVPYAVAFPAALAGDFSLYMTQKIETVMSSVNGNYLSVTDGISPFTPARILLSFTTCPLDPLRCMDQNMVETMGLAARYCGGGDLSNARFEKSQDVLTDFANTLTKQGSTIIYDSTDPYVSGGGGGRAATCSEAASYIRSVAQATQSGSGSPIVNTMQGLASQSNVAAYKSIADATAGQETDWDKSLELINKVSNANSNLDTLALSNVLTYSIANSLKYNAQSPVDSSIEIKAATGLFEWAKSDSQQSMLVSATAPKFMDVLFFIFIASTPIVMFVVMANPSTGLKVAGAYALFGLWTQSWIPMMAIITFWYQTEIQNFPAPITGQGMTIEYVSSLMHHVMTTTIAASNMLQQAPYIMFAIMSGSMFAMANLIGKATPGSHAGEGSTEAGGGKGGGAASRVLGAGASGIPAMSQMAAINGAQAALGYGLGSNAAFTGGPVDASVPGLANLEIGAAASAGLSAANEKGASLQQQLSAQKAMAMAETKGLIESAANTLGGEKMAQLMTNNGIAATYDARTGKMTSDVGTIDFRSGQTNSTSTGSGARFELGAKSSGAVLGKIAELIAGAYASGALTAAFDSTRRQDASVGQDQSHQTGTTGQTGRGVSATTGTNGGIGSRGSAGNNWGKMAEDAQRLSNTWQKIAAETKALTDANKLVDQGASSANASSGATIKGSDVAQNWGAMVSNKNGGKFSETNKDAVDKVLAAVSGAIPGNKLPQLENAMNAEMRQMENAGLHRTLNKDQMAAVAAWRVMSNMSTSNDPGVKMEGFNGRAKLAAASGLQDMAEPLRNISQGLGIMQRVSDDIAKMKHDLKPVVDAATKEGEKKLSPENTKKFEGEVAEQIKTNKAAAQETYGGAAAGANAIPARGEKLVDNKAADVTQAANDPTAPSRMLKLAQDATNRQAQFYVGKGDLDYGIGQDTNGLNFAANLVTGAANAGLKAAGGMPEFFTGVANAGTNAAAPVAGALPGAANAGTAAAAPVAGAAGGGASLPTLGGGNGTVNLTPGGGGSQVPAPQNNAPQTQKPNAGHSGGGTPDSGKGKIPGRG